MSNDGPRTTFLGKLVILAFVAACGWGAYRLFLLRGGKPLTSAAPNTILRVACDDAKRVWLTEAAAAFAKSPEGREIDVQLLPLPATDVNVFAPASSLQKDPSQSLLNEKSIALSPMVFVIWSSRLPAFRAKYGELTLESVARALAEPRGWEAAGHPEWGLFKFAIDDRLMAAALLTYDQGEKVSGLTPQDALEAGTKPALQSVARNATFTSMRDFAARGPDAYDAAFVEEASALDLLDAAQKRGGELRILYPRRNLWAENPYYILDGSWSTPGQRDAAQKLLDFLLSEAGQQQAVAHGFRPVDPHVPTNASGSPFVLYAKNGVQEKSGQTCALPSPAVLANLLAAWQRAR
jgi:Ca-activated chloride channel family protein